MELDSEIDALYAGPAEEFIASRNALVKRLRAASRREEASRVAGLRRPSLLAWALNQVARQHPDDVEQLLAAGVELQQAQRRLLSGIRDDRLRNATRHRRQLIDRLGEHAAGVLAAAGRGASHPVALAATLEAASVDPEIGETLRTGRLTTDVPPPSGFGELSGLVLAEPPEAPERADAEPGAQAAAEEDRALQEARDDVEHAQRAVAEAAGQVEAGRARAGIARREADQSAATARRLQAEADAAQRLAERAGTRAEREEAALQAAMEEQRATEERLEQAHLRLRGLDKGR